MDIRLTHNRRFWTSLLIILAGIVIVGVMLNSVVPDRSPDDQQANRSRPLDQLNEPLTQRTPLPAIEASNIQSASPIAQEYRALEPTRGSWSSESMHDLVNGQLKRLGKLLEHAESLDADHLEQLVSTDFSSGYLRPRLLETVFESSAFMVRRPSEIDTTDGTGGTILEGIEGALLALQDFTEPLKEMKRRRMDAKTFRITVESDVVVSRTLIVFSGQGPINSIQQNATWECRWDIGRQGTPRLLNVKVADYEQANVRNSQGPSFEDMTQFVFGGNECFRWQLEPGMDYWTARVEQGLGMYLDGWSGLAIGDVNNDGLEDLYVCQPGGLPNRLFLHLPDGSTTEVAHKYGVDWLDRSTGALFIDLNNDGRQDLVIAMRGGVLLMQNDGNGFRLRQFIPTDGQPYSLAAADFNNDSRLDIFVCCYNRGALAAQQGGLDVPVPYYDANNGAANLLLRNEGDFLMSDVTSEVGMGVNNQRFSYAAAWEDFDNDGDQDLYVANDFGRNNLYRNDRGRFSDVAAQAGVEDVGSGMSVSWSDYDGDGWMDVYVGNMFSAAGSRITYQRQFSAVFNESALASVRRLARGNTLFANAGDGTMRDVSIEAGVTMGRWAWSSNFVDINNDGREDLVVANGFVTGVSDVDL